MCQPTSNKDKDSDLDSSVPAAADTIDAFSSVMSSSSRAMNLRDMMRRVAAASL